MKAKHSFGAAADFDYKVIDGVLVIEDLNQGSKSVTNDAESVVQTIYDEFLRRFEAFPKVIVYRDSDGMYDGMSVKFAGSHVERVAFYAIQTTNRSSAIEKAKVMA